MNTTRPILNKAHDLIRKDRLAEAGDTLLYDLYDFRKTVGQQDWFDTHVPEAHYHLLMPTMLECPFSWHSFTKPRGYAGDAMLIDYLYKENTVARDLEAATPLGRAIHDYWIAAPAAAAVRSRRDLFARLIDETAERCEDAEIFSVACGHLREASQARALRENKIKRFVALDQDAESLAVVARNFPNPPVTTVNRSIRGILAGKAHYGLFDLIYASGLYDYLDARVARRFTANLFAMLKPQGTLVVPNFLDTAPSCASLEIFADWRLIYRNPAEIEDCFAEIPACEIASMEYFAECSGSVGFVVMKRT